MINDQYELTDLEKFIKNFKSKFGQKNTFDDTMNIIDKINYKNNQQFIQLKDDFHAILNKIVQQGTKDSRY